MKWTAKKKSIRKKKQARERGAFTGPLSCHVQVTSSGYPH